MASGPVVRQGRIILELEIAAPKGNASPAAAALADQQTKVAEANTQAAASATVSTEALQNQAAVAINLNKPLEELTEAEWRVVAGAEAVAQATTAQAASQSQAANTAESAAAAGDSWREATVKSWAAQDNLHAANLRVVSSTVGVAKGFAFIAASQSDGLAKTLPYILAFEGLYQVIQKVAALSTVMIARTKALAAAEALGAVATTGFAGAMATLMTVLTPLNVLLATLALAAWAVNKAYNAVTTSAEEVAEADKKHKEQIEAAAAALESANERQAIRLAADLETIDNLDTLAQKEKALQAAIESRAQIESQMALARSAAKGAEPALQEHILGAAINEVEQQKSATQKLLDVEKEIADKAKDKIKDQVQLVKLREKEFDTAKKALQTEEEKARALRAQIGVLDSGEQNKLKRLLESADNGNLTRKQAVDLQKLGGKAGSDIAEVFLAKMDKGLGDLAEKVRSKVTGDDPRAEKAQADFQRAQQNLGAATGGKTAEAKLQELEDAKKQVVDTFDAMANELRAKMRQFVADLSELQTEQSRARQGARQAAK